MKKSSGNEDVTILVCCHKKDYYYDGPGFLPIQVGKALHPELDLGIQGDDEGDNISELNPNFCELTAHYWYWKNCKHSKYVGLNHYRRYFAFNKKTPYGTSFLNVDEETIQSSNDISSIQRILNEYDIILAKPNIYPYSLFTDYSCEHIKNDIKILEQVIHQISPEYDDSFYQVIHRNNKLSHYNMFITKNEIFEEYSEWLFKVLFEVQKRVKISDYTDQARIFGYMSERMLIVFVRQKNLKVKYLPVYKVSNDNNYSMFRNHVIAIKHSIAARILCKKHPLLRHLIH